MSRRSLGGFTFVDDESGFIWVYWKTGVLGGYDVNRYAEGTFGSEWMRQFVADIETKTRGD